MVGQLVVRSWCVLGGHVDRVWSPMQLHIQHMSRISSMCANLKINGTDFQRV